MRAQEYSGKYSGRSPKVVFLQNIPSLISEALRQLFCENINVIEFIQRQIENSLQVLSILLNRSQERGCDNQLQNNIRTLFSELQGLQESYERLCIQNDHSQHFSCPVEVGRNRDRGRYVLPENSMSGLWRIHHSWVQVAADLGVSYRTLLRRRHEFGLPVSDSDIKPSGSTNGEVLRTYSPGIIYISRTN